MSESDTVKDKAVRSEVEESRWLVEEHCGSVAGGCFKGLRTFVVRQNVLAPTQSRLERSWNNLQASEGRCGIITLHELISNLCLFPRGDLPTTRPPPMRWQGDVVDVERTAASSDTFQRQLP